MYEGDTTVAGPGTETELIEAFLTAFFAGDDAIGDLVTEDATLHQVWWPQETNGREAIVETTVRNAGTFADVDVTVQQFVVDDDRVAAFAKATGRNVGPMVAGDREIAPTGREFEVPQFGIYRLEDGRIGEAWVLADALGIMEQLGTLPTGPGALARIGLRQLRWRFGGGD